MPQSRMSNFLRRRLTQCEYCIFTIQTKARFKSSRDEKLSFVPYHKSIYKQAHCRTENFVDQICDRSAEVGGKL